MSATCVFTLCVYHVRQARLATSTSSHAAVQKWRKKPGNADKSNTAKRIKRLMESGHTAEEAARIDTEKQQKKNNSQKKRRVDPSELLQHAPSSRSGQLAVSPAAQDIMPLPSLPLPV
jgi:hypothetical protein